MPPEGSKLKEAWIGYESFCRNTLAKASWQDIAWTLGVFLSPLAFSHPGEVLPDEVENFHQQRSLTTAEARWRNEFKYLRAFWDWMIERDYATSNPFRQWERLKERKSQSESLAESGLTVLMRVAKRKVQSSQ